MPHVQRGWSIPLEAWGKLTERAEAERLSENAVVVRALQAYLDLPLSHPKLHPPLELCPYLENATCEAEDPPRRFPLKALVLCRTKEGWARCPLRVNNSHLVEKGAKV